MARYDAAPRVFLTPRGNGCAVFVREGTNDWNTAYSCLNEDEYGTRDLDFEGTFLDIGGYLGTVSLAILIDHPNTRAVIVEPIPENREMIAANLEINRLADRAKVVAGAVGVGTVTIDYAWDGSENDLHHAFVGNGWGHFRKGNHRSVTYNALRFADLDDGSVRMVKIDCEGGEWGFLDQLGAVPLVMGELHAVDEHAPADALPLLPGHEFTFTYHPDAPEDPTVSQTCGFRAVRRA